MELVEIKESGVYCDSSMIAKKFGVKHAYVINNCDKLIADIEKIKGRQYQPLIIKEAREYRGAEFTAYMMDRNFFTLLSMRFRGEKALEWQIKFNNAFYEMELKIIDGLKPSSSMEEINNLVKIAESDKDMASAFGKGLAAYRSKKKDNAKKLNDMINTVQLSLGFEE